MPVAKPNLSLQAEPYTFPQTDDVLMPSNGGKKILLTNVTKFLYKYGRKKLYNKGHYIIREGHLDKTVFVILSGEVEVLKKDETGKDKVITTLNGGGIILGEMSIFLDEPRSSSVRISQETTLLEFTGDSFMTAVVNIPELSMRMLKSLSSKLKSTNERVVESNICKSCKEKRAGAKTESTADDDTITEPSVGGAQTAAET